MWQDVYAEEFKTMVRSSYGDPCQPQQMTMLNNWGGSGLANHWTLPGCTSK